MCNYTVISWRSTKQVLVVTLFNHDEILAIHKESREYMWMISTT